MKEDMPHSLELVQLVQLDTELQMQLRLMLAQDWCAKQLFDGVPTEANEFLGWISQLKQDDTQLAFAVFDEAGQPQGLMHAQAISHSHKKADWRHCLQPSMGTDLGALLEFHWLDFLFDKLGMEKLNTAVPGNHRALLAQHRQFLFQPEGICRANLIQGKERLDVHFLGLLKSEWQQGRRDLKQAHAEAWRPLSISINWQEPENALHPIDQIEAARARNNLNWMSILRLALEKSPATAQPIVAEIKRLDREISALTDKLTND